MKSILLVAALALSAPAAAVTVTSVSASGANTATIVAAEPGLLAADVAFFEFSPIRLGLEAEPGEAAFAFNSLVDSFTGVTVGAPLSTLHLTLGGARFAVVGDIAPAFSEAAWSLNDAGTRLTIRFLPEGEGVGAALGNALADGAQDFVIEATGGPLSLTFSSAVPEPASWALMIAGFGLAGAALRRREPAAA